MSQYRNSNTNSTPALVDKPLNVSIKKIQAGHFARRLEKACVVSLVLAMCSQLNAQVSLPTYNSVLAGWGLFAAYSRRGPAVFGLLAFTGLSFILDVVFLTLWSSGESAVLARDDDSTAATTTAFSVAMVSLNLAAKTTITYFAAHLYAVLSQPVSLPNSGLADSKHEFGGDIRRATSVSAARDSEATPPSTPAAALRQPGQPGSREFRSPGHVKSPNRSSEFKTDESPQHSQSSKQSTAFNSSDRSNLVRPPGTSAVPKNVPALNLSQTPKGSGTGLSATSLGSGSKGEL